jgi:hypothetical protein
VRFGLAVSAPSVSPKYLICFAVQPIPGDLVARQIVFDTIATMTMGIVCAWTSQDQPA